MLQSSQCDRIQPGAECDQGVGQERSSIGFVLWSSLPMVVDNVRSCRTGKGVPCVPMVGQCRQRGKLAKLEHMRRTKARDKEFLWWILAKVRLVPCGDVRDIGSWCLRR